MTFALYSCTLLFCVFDARAYFDCGYVYSSADHGRNRWRSDRSMLCSRLHRLLLSDTVAPTYIPSTYLYAYEHIT